MNSDIDLVTEEIELEDLPDGNALGTFSTQSSASSASCPASTAGSASTVACLG